jgi:hypothetical protein
MSKRRMKSRHIKSKSYPIPHNNRADTGGRRVRKQLIIFDKVVADPKDATKTKVVKAKKTVFHVNYSTYEQSRIHMIKTAVANGDPEILAKLSPRERKIYDNMIKMKETETNEGESNT